MQVGMGMVQVEMGMVQVGMGTVQVGMGTVQVGMELCITAAASTVSIHDILPDYVGEGLAC